MEKQKIILGYRPGINHTLLGFTYFKVLFYLTNVNKKEYLRMLQYLKVNPRLTYRVEEIGICDVDVELMLESSEDFFEFLKQIKYTFPGMIKEHETILMGTTIKLIYLPFD